MVAANGVFWNDGPERSDDGDRSATLSGLNDSVASTTQGSRCAATLGYPLQSLRDNNTKNCLRCRSPKGRHSWSVVRDDTTIGTVGRAFDTPIIERYGERSLQKAGHPRPLPAGEKIWVSGTECHDLR